MSVDDLDYPDYLGDTMANDPTLPPQTKLEKTEADAKTGWAWLQIHPLILGVLIGVVIGFGSAAWIFSK